ncbi:MAG: phospho-N-acetylmuramoyl-pentapeptide-transferase [Negativicutes bacterium]|nr:phospho-N-acetylmuramoyl-pentapeptide-transferase [Negativicutes bacterium]
MLTAGYAGLCAAMLAVALTPAILPVLRRLKCGQQVRSDGPATHLGKQGTPTIGGIIFLLAAGLATLAFAGGDRWLWPLAVLTIGHAGLGFADDYIKVARHRSLGLRAKQKLVGQTILALWFAWQMVATGQSDGRIWLPLAGVSWDMGGWYYPLVAFIIVGTSNAVNLTDGVDGLASSVSAVVTLAYAVIGYILNQPAVMIASLAMCGGLLGFLPANSYPARVFMGDTGSLALGAFIAGLAVVSHTEMLLPLIGIIYLAEALSVIIQVGYFRYSGGRRVFRMSPLHHHFELGGWRERQIVGRFSAITAVAAILAITMVHYGSR